MKLFACGFNDNREIFSLKGSAADESAVNVYLCNQLVGILCVHRTAVLDCNGLCYLCAVDFRNSGTDIAVALVSLLGGGGNACADCSYRLVSDYYI